MHSTFAEHTLPNGLRVVCETMPGVRSSAAGFLVKTGSRHEYAHEHGISHFLEHMCFKGTQKRDWRAINLAFDNLGASYNAFTGKEHTVYYGLVPSDRLVSQLELLADMMRPAIPQGEFETERKVILEEIAMNGDSFDRQVMNSLHRLIFVDHPLAHEILGEKSSIESVPRGVMTDYLRERYAPNNMILAACGGFDPQEFFAAASRYCGHWVPDATSKRELPAPALNLSGSHAHELPQFKQQSLILLYPSVPYGHEISESIGAFCSLFGGANSRCFWNIVQKGISTSAGVAWLSYADCGMLAFYADGEPERCEEMYEALRNEMRGALQEGFDERAIQRVKNQRRTQLALEAESPRTRLMQVIDDLEEHDYPKSVANRLADVEAVSSKSIARYFQEHPVDGAGMLLCCGPRRWPADATLVTKESGRPRLAKRRNGKTPAASRK